MMNTEQYLARINVKVQTKPDLKTLVLLHENHLLNVPFENLDIHSGKQILLNPAQIYQKIVINQRGGFCYELNGIFYYLLEELGFSVKRISARVYQQDENYGEEYDHMAIIATIDGQEYLVDVGFGKFSFHPLPILMERIVEDKFGDFWFDRYDDGYLRINKYEKGILSPVYIFKNTHTELNHFEHMCSFHQSSPQSNFTKNKVISVITSDGRITLSSNQLKITKNGAESLMHFGADKYDFLLKKYFDIIL